MFLLLSLPFFPFLSSSPRQKSATKEEEEEEGKKGARVTREPTSQLLSVSPFTTSLLYPSMQYHPGRVPIFIRMTMTSLLVPRPSGVARDDERQRAETPRVLEYVLVRVC